MWSGQARWGNAGRVMYGQARSGADGFGKVWQVLQGVMGSGAVRRG